MMMQQKNKTVFKKSASHQHIAFSSKDRDDDDIRGYSAARIRKELRKAKEEYASLAPKALDPRRTVPPVPPKDLPEIIKTANYLRQRMNMLRKALLNKSSRKFSKK